jgi:hypothetical protein
MFNPPLVVAVVDTIMDHMHTSRKISRLLMT